MRGGSGSCRKKDKDIDKDTTSIIASGAERHDKEHDSEKHIDNSKVFPADGNAGVTLAVESVGIGMGILTGIGGESSRVGSPRVLLSLTSERTISFRS